MITITLSQIHTSKIAAVTAMSMHEIDNNPNLNGARIEIVVGDFVDVDCADEIAGAQLLANVISILQDDLAVQS